MLAAAVVMAVLAGDPDAYRDSPKVERRETVNRRRRLRTSAPEPLADVPPAAPPAPPPKAAPEPLQVVGAVWRGNDLELSLSRPAGKPAVSVEGVRVDPKKISAVAPNRVNVRLGNKELGDNDKVTVSLESGAERAQHVVPVPRRVVSPLEVLGFIIAGALGLAAAMFLLSRRRRGPVAARASFSAPAGAAPDGMALWRPSGESASFDVPAPPAALIEGLRKGRCVLFAGAGVALGAELPTWQGVLHELVERLDSQHGQSGVARQALGAGKYELVADLLNTMLGPEELQRQVREMFERRKTPATPLVRALARLPFAGVITPNYDGLLEQAFQARKPTVLSAASGKLDAAARAGGFSVVKLFGALAEPGDLLLGDAQYRAAVTERTFFARYLGSMALSSSLFFVGASLETIELFFSSLNLPPAQQPHFAVVPAGSETGAYGEVLRAKYGVHLIVVDPTPGMGAVTKLIESLATPTAGSGKAHDIQPFHIHRITLGNIGAFRELTLELRSSWTVLIGNNGCGKSTILKAIALGLCGDDVQAAQAGRKLLRAGASAGFIELHIEGTRYRTELSREGERVRVSSRQLTPLQHGRWVALGFPPVRGVSVQAQRGPAADGADTPVVGDLLPLLTGSIDSRIDNLKQWIINLDVRAREGTAQARRCARLLGAFFAMMKELTPGSPFKFHKVDQTTWEVMVETTDGTVPIDLLSQGMSSILGWAGGLLQRMYEIHGDEDRPEEQPALLLLDEVDAHLHPLWQQKLVPLLRNKFPGLQVVATTHSPLVVAGLRKEELYTLRREQGSILVEEPPWNLQGWRVDQILTSPTFALEGARDIETVNKVSRYTELASKLEPSEAEQTELVALADDIKVSLPPPESQPHVREAAGLIVDALRSKLAEMPEQKKQQMEQEIRVQVQEAITGSRRPS